MICPLDYRYGREEMKRIFEENARLEYMLRVEGAIALAQADFGNIPAEMARKINEMATSEHVKLERVKEIENRIKHDVMAIVKALSEVCGDAGKFVHFGATSNDIIDTANAVQIKEALEILLKGLGELRKVLLTLAKEHRNTVMIGRTHGQHAVPITFGLKMAVFAVEIARHEERIKQGMPRFCAGKLLGAVGTGAALGANALEIQEKVMEKLGIWPENGCTQVVGRDRYIELVCLLANIVTTCEKFATEIRNLQRTEINEVAEHFEESQVGSSTMPHKRNPVLAENICGLARIARALVVPAFENNIMWHERDLANSSAERFIIPHAFILCDDIIHKTLSLFRKLNVNVTQMRENIELTRGLVMAERVMIELTKRGMGRQEAHELVRKLSMEALAQKKHLRDLLLERQIFDRAGLEKIFEAGTYVGVAPEIVDRIVKELGD
ncbi:MAG: adenylosuccinate lyase [Thermoplasmata archaeon]|nr:adenylosuccinate lyase [Thermoplasmata archaeon]